MAPSEVVKKYLQDQNRPYSANDIFMNLHKEIGKTAVQKALDQLVEKGDIIEKTYGKQKVYVIKQEDNVARDFEKELDELDSNINDVSGKLSLTEEELKSLESQLRELQATPTTEEAEREYTALEVRFNELKEKLNTLSQNTIRVSPVYKVEIKKNYDNNIKAWRKRKRQCMDIIDSILEGYPKDKKALLEEVGIETDEAANISVTL